MPTSALDVAYVDGVEHAAVPEAFRGVGRIGVPLSRWVVVRHRRGQIPRKPSLRIAAATALRLDKPAGHSTTGHLTEALGRAPPALRAANGVSLATTDASRRGKASRKGGRLLLTVYILFGHTDDMTTALLNRRATEPLHIQLRRALVAEIRERPLRPGARIPSEPELEQRYGVSRSTIRQALASLAADGIIQRIQGRGTFVANPEVSHVPRLTSFTENMLAQGHIPSKELLESIRVPAPILPALDLSSDRVGGECRFLRRLLLADGRPVGLAETWIPLLVLQGHDAYLECGALGNKSLYAVLAAPPISLHLDHGSELIYADLTDVELSGLLKCPEGAPVLVAERTTYTQGARLAEFTRMRFASDRYVYRVDLKV